MSCEMSYLSRFCGFFSSLVSVFPCPVSLLHFIAHVFTLVCSRKHTVLGIGGRDSVVGTASHCGWTVRASKHGGGKMFSLHIRPDRPGGPPSHLYNGYRGSLQGVRRLRR